MRIEDVTNSPNALCLITTASHPMSTKVRQDLKARIYYKTLLAEVK